MTHEHWMNQALELARAAGREDEVPVGALLVLDGEVIGLGANARERTRRTVAHAEIMALEDFGRRTGEWRLPVGAALYVTAEPCLMCTGSLLWARVSHLFYGCSDPRKAGLGVVLANVDAGTFDHRFQTVQGGILGETCGELMSEYFRRKRQLLRSKPHAKDPRQVLECP